MLFVVAWWQKKDTTKQPRWFPTFFQINRIFGAKKKMQQQKYSKKPHNKMQKGSSVQFHLDNAGNFFKVQTALEL